MTSRFNCHDASTSAYFARPAERLVLEGYRHCTFAAAARDAGSWQHAADLYREIIGERGSATAMRALADFVAVLGRCATCPLKTFRSGSAHVCRDEILVMGLIAGIQNDDGEAVSLCLGELACHTRCDEVALAAGSFAFVLRGLDRTLLPIPAPVVRDILDRAWPAKAETHANRTFH